MTQSDKHYNQNISVDFKGTILGIRSLFEPGNKLILNQKDQKDENKCPLKANLLTQR